MAYDAFREAAGCGCRVAEEAFLDMWLRDNR